MRSLFLVALLAAAPPKSGRDQNLLQLIERQTQIAHLLTSGKLAYDAGDYATAASRWEVLLRIDGVAAAVRPLAADARSRAGAALLPGETAQPAAAREEPKAPPPVTVAGTISG